MIVLDTNVVSEVMKPAPDVRVIDWLHEQNSSKLYLSTITIAEIRFGLRVMPKGRRRTHLSERFSLFLVRGFEQRLLGFDLDAAEHFGDLMADRRRIGRPMSMPDGQIAAIARSRGLAVATRNVRDFESCGVETLNPFEWLG